MSVTLKILGRPVAAQAVTRSQGDAADRAEFLDQTIRVSRDETYDLKPVRDQPLAVQSVDLADKDAVAITLADDHIVWLPAEDLPRLLEKTREGTLEISAATRFDVPAAERGILSAGIKLLRILGFDLETKASESLVQWVGNRVEAKVVNQTTVYRCGFDGNVLSMRPSAINPDSPEQPVLLLLHGTGSNTAGSFGHLWSKHAQDWSRLIEPYAGHIYALEHRTLTESPIDNVCAILDQLSHVRQEIHVISHSRGGIVGELLCRSMVADNKAPITRAEIDQVVIAYSNLDGNTQEEQEAAREIQQSIKQKLDTLAKKLQEKRPEVTRFVRVACPARGTGLADERLDLFFNMLLWGAGNLSRLIPGDADLLQDLAAAIRTVLMRTIKQRFDPRVLPGLECMVPGTPLQRFINNNARSLRGRLAVITGNADVSLNPLQLIATALLNVYYREPNDWIVETGSMTGGHPRLEPLWVAADKGGHVSHFYYFRNQQSVSALLDALSDSADTNRFVVRTRPPTITATGLRVRGATPAPTAGTVFFLPGFPGSHLRQLQDRRRIWLDAGVITGNLAELDINNGADAIEPEALINYLLSSAPYGRFVSHLKKSNFTVEPFPYDWRLSVAHNGARFADELRRVLDLDPQREFPVHIVCHSMGGLVALYSILERPDLWREMCRHPDSRLLLAGTPLKGAYNTVQLITGKHCLARISALLDLTRSHADLVSVFRRFQGLLLALPRWPQASFNFFHGPTWAAIRGQDQRDFPWQPPLDHDLDTTLAQVQKTERIPDHCERIHYLAGIDQQTPSGIGFTNGELKFTSSSRPDGDGLALWEHSIPDYARTWHLPDVEHGSLFDRGEYFAAIVEILQQGYSARLPEGLPAVRTTERAQVQDLREEPLWLQPNEDDMLRALLVGGRERPLTESAAASELPAIQIVHGDVRKVQRPAVVGHYEGDSINGSERAMDDLTGGLMKQRHEHGHYPGAVETVEIFTPVKDPEQHTVIVAGLGRMGMLTGPKLRRTFANALVRFSVHRQEQYRFCGESPANLQVCALIVGSGEGALPLAQALTSLLRALVDANQRLQAIAAPLIGGLRFVERYEDTAIQSARILDTLLQEFDGILDIDTTVQTDRGGLSARYSFQSDSWWRIVRIEQHDQTIDFAPVGDRAASPTLHKVNQCDLVNDLVELAVADHALKPRFGEALFELLIPHDYKEDVGDQMGIQLLLDETTARFPWEMLHDRHNRLNRPLAVETGIVRQLNLPDAPAFRLFNQMPTALVIADTLGDLPGAREEGEKVKGLLEQHNFQASLAMAGNPTDATVQLLTGDYRVLHLATHGEYLKDHEHASTALILGEDPRTGRVVRVLPDVFDSLRQVPELVFINCCHLGRIEARKEEQARDRHALAASVASAFLKLGARAVIAAGWVVYDPAALCFAETFYDGMLRLGLTFGDAVLAARRETYTRFPGANTWSAYQCYGESVFRLAQDKPHETYRIPQRFHAASEFAAWLRDYPAQCGNHQAGLDRLRGRLSNNTPAEERWITGDAQVQEALGHVFGELGDFKTASEYYTQALAHPSGAISLKGVEQASNLSIRWIEKDLEGETRIASGAMETVDRLFSTAIDRVEQLRRIGDNAERMNLQASAYKHRAVIRLRLDRGTLHKKGLEDLEVARDLYRESQRVLTQGGHPAQAGYPQLNAIALDILLRRIGHSAKAQTPPRDLLREIGELESEMASGSANFWMRTDKLNLRLVRHLIQNELDTDQATALASAYNLEFSDATQREADSVVKQIRLIREFLTHYSQKNKPPVVAGFEHLVGLLVYPSG